MTIDEPTLMMVLGAASLTASAMFFTLHASARHIAGVRLWAFGTLAVGFAVILDGPRLIENWQWASLLFNIPLGLGQAFFLVGTAQFVGRPCPKWLLPALAALVVMLTLVFTLLLPDSVPRIASLSSFQAATNAFTSWLLWRHREARSRYAYAVASVVTLAQAGSALAQALFVLTSPVAITYAAPELPIVNIVTWVATMSNILIGNWILFLLVMLRLVGELRAAAGNDALTGLLNRRGLRLHVDGLLEAERSTTSLAVLLLDVDHFKRINDEYGHEVGDKVLATMGEVLHGLGGAHAVPCRWGGEEFCFVVDGFTGRSLSDLAEQARQGFHRMTQSLLPAGATVSIGLAAMRVDHGFEFSRLVALADTQLYLAKHGGRNRVCGASVGLDNAAPGFMI
ncbi:diguanylate cyclase [Massilia sp. Dwa41.01b]|uniref:GGDEF domain-containing protein n=1 Tax=unclassified Massilia TaxID=2609279 RepID=UPI001601B2F8|nr:MULTISPECIES: diguanylate cyclase [unclassified Massilia]QNA88619.1 diguanylate cyclase [Massilia sp. Dwa41.01b]QNA99509.1 diguanylate cyclase [Massilia sp. Se16.2.3]